VAPLRVPTCAPVPLTPRRMTDSPANTLPVTALLFCVALPLFGAVVNQAANVIVPIMDDVAAVLIHIDEMLINHRPKEQLRVSVPARRICDVLR